MQNELTHQRQRLPSGVQNSGFVAMFSRVAEVMTPDILTLNPQQRFADAVALMANQFIRHILVVDSDGKLCGVISDRDVLRALARTPNWNSKFVSEIMTDDSITVASDAPISSAVRLMLEKHINCLPVMDEDHRVCGILTSTDLLKAYEKIQGALEQHQVSPGMTAA